MQLVLQVLLATWSSRVSVLRMLRCVTSIIAICSNDVAYTAHFDFNSIATSSSDKEIVEDCVSLNANDLAIMADVADGFPQ